MIRKLPLGQYIKCTVLTGLVAIVSRLHMVAWVYTELDYIAVFRLGTPCCFCLVKVVIERI